MDSYPFQGYPSIKFARTHLSTLWREALCLTQEHSASSLAKTKTETSRSRDECANHRTSPLCRVGCSKCQLVDYERSVTDFLLFLGEIVQREEIRP